MEVFTERGHQDISPILSEDVCESIGSVNKPAWGPELDTFLLTAHYVYIVS
ncbi:hypothetical protein HSR121_0778 [Halapricum desulfuricans]|uniref:Uncharacterized protein n=1 Tax=Halapricum desulfuricans TaxID=2841257 RepID=A0A897MX15_9EURY|nr:hypothetical protein HSR121_0778 [Halapricum desulfuricans]